MNVIIFVDKNNFDGSLNLINDGRDEDKKRFWDINKYIPFIFEKFKETYKDKFNKDELKLIKVIFYTGRYNARIINAVKWECKNKIWRLQRTINLERDLLRDIRKNCDLKQMVHHNTAEHILSIIKNLKEKQESFTKQIDRQIRNKNAQQKFFNNINSFKFPAELKTTLLKNNFDGDVFQKGVDVSLATDLVHLAHTQAYDFAIILSGDTDLVEAVKCVKENLSRTVAVVSYYAGDSSPSNISDLKDMVQPYFINLKDFTEAEIVKMSELMRRNSV
ncbi:MAG: NYN domain-containing protein [Nanoarchaeota archaeon]|nr:NYN domain-containing protein [Nanoarchaeota archaeon]